MTVTVGTDSYNTEAELTDYAALRGITIAGDPTTLLINAMDWLETNPFIGNRYDLDQLLGR